MIHSPQVDNFSYLVSALGVLGATGLLTLASGPLLKRKESRYWKASGSLWLATVAIVVPWCLLMFRAGSSVLHQGSYGPVLLALCACTITTWAFSRILTVALVIFQLVLTLAVYRYPITYPDLTVPQLSVATNNYLLLVFSLASFALMTILVLASRQQGSTK